MRAVTELSSVKQAYHGAGGYSFARLLTILVLALLLSSCAMVGPDFQKPEATVNDEWSGVGDAAIVAESARWGDLHRAQPFTREDWLREQRILRYSYFTVEGGPNRIAVFGTSSIRAP